MEGVLSKADWVCQRAVVERDMKEAEKRENSLEKDLLRFSSDYLSCMYLYILT